MKQVLKVYKEKGSYIGVLPNNCVGDKGPGDLIKKARNRANTEKLKKFRASFSKAGKMGLKKKKEIFRSFQQTALLLL